MYVKLCVHVYTYVCVAAYLIAGSGFVANRCVAYGSKVWGAVAAAAIIAVTAAAAVRGPRSVGQARLEQTRSNRERGVASPL